MFSHEPSAKTLILKAFGAYGPKTIILKAFGAHGPKTQILKAFMNNTFFY